MGGVWVPDVAGDEREGTPPPVGCGKLNTYLFEQARSMACTCICRSQLLPYQAACCIAEYNPPTLSDRLAPAAKAMEGNLLFEQLSLPAKQAIIRSMRPQSVKAGDTIIQQARCSSLEGRISALNRMHLLLPMLPASLQCDLRGAPCCLLPGCPECSHPPSFCRGS